MKLKFYLRGLGIGIFITALIMTIASSGNNAMTDEEIMQRAAELGMVTPKTLLSQVEEDGSEMPKETVAPTKEPEEMSTKEPEVVVTEVPTEEPPQITTPEPTTEPVEEPTSTPEIQETVQTPAPGEKATLTVYSGEHSLTVSKRMQELGLIEDYQDFDDYLCDNGYSRYVNSGVYKISQGLSYEELAKIITRRE